MCWRILGAYTPPLPLCLWAAQALDFLAEGTSWLQVTMQHRNLLVPLTQNVVIQNGFGALKPHNEAGKWKSITGQKYAVVKRKGL